MPIPRSRLIGPRRPVRSASDGSPPRILILRAVLVPVALVVGLAGGAVIGIVGRGESLSSVQRPLEVAATPSPLPPSEPLLPDTLLAWTPGGLPDGLGTGVAAIPGVDNVVSVVSGTAWLTSSTTPDGTRVDRPPSGLAIPIEVAAADPLAYAPFLTPADRSLLPALARGQALLGTTAATLRHLGPGAILIFGSHRLRVAAVVPDAEIGAHEVFVSRTMAGSLKVRRDRYLLIDPSKAASRKKITRGIRKLLPPGGLLRVRGPGETPFFRQGDAVLPPVRLKELFGEFAASPLPNGYLKMDPAWEATNIVRARVPVLGKVRCNRALIPQLRGALRQVERDGLAALVDTSQYAGCYSSRFLNRNPEAGISHHAWGVALDVNAVDNPFGQTPHQDPRVVAAFQAWGFVWGGDWLLPDGMHLEFVGFPPGR